MHYTQYEEKIVQQYGIELEGWTYEKLTNPSNLSSSLPPLKALQDVIISGTCKFIKLTAAEKKKHEAVYMSKIKSGEIELCKHKQRSDAGVSKKTKWVHREDSENDEEEMEKGQDEGNAYKSQEIIDDSDNSGDE